MVLSRKTHLEERNCWGHKFLWTDLHESKNQLRRKIYTYDSLADECLLRLNNISPKESPREGDGKPSRDLYALLRNHSDEDTKLKRLWTQVNTIPEWVDWEQIKRGQEVFYRYGLPILNTLNFESLLGGMGSGRVVETLSRTGGFSTYVARRRMFETLQYVLQVTSSVESIKPDGDGHASSVRVRLLHAAVRQRILELAKEQPEYFDVEKLGVPINDLDSIGTIHTFSTAVVWLGLPRQGIWLREQEIDDYIALWRLVAHYQGTATESLESKAKARAMMESLLASEFNPTDMSKILAKNIILSLENTAPSYSSKEFMEAMARRLNGDQLSDSLDIPRPGIYYRALIYGYCIVVMAFAYAVRLFPSLDQNFIEIRRKRYHKIVMDKETGLGGETIFEFKHIPKLTRTTRLGKRRISTREKHGLETLALIGLFGAAGAVAIFSFWTITLLRYLDLGPVFVGDVLNYLKMSQSRLLFLGDLL
ncbi:hypothetical protein PHISCL_03346 [Aspergillus sclerotialis]|uniref:ER-bound oxygenase mpaB/mpaB'/Rubber oxygenase catalytic domain-containing protein n=1 Tax=Aspergillus sclerotialis TaxID=2070753 RepID=A0A3A3A4Q8_9EURO|nr:hypothetical protein PHISCL_03346 [Aspergillus sclerotialis]